MYAQQSTVSLGSFVIRKHKDRPRCWKRLIDDEDDSSLHTHKAASSTASSNSTRNTTNITENKLTTFIVLVHGHTCRRRFLPFFHQRQMSCTSYLYLRPTMSFQDFRAALLQVGRRYMAVPEIEYSVWDIAHVYVVVGRKTSFNTTREKTVLVTSANWSEMLSKILNGDGGDLEVTYCTKAA